MFKKSYEQFEEEIWEDFLQSGLEEEDWLDFLSDAIESYNDLQADNWRDYQTY